MIFSALVLSSCSRNPINKIFDDAKKEDNILALSLPGWMVQKGVKLAMKDEKVGSDVNEINTVAGAIKKVRVLVKSNNTVEFTSKMNKSVADLSSKNFETYAMIKSGDTNVTVYGKEKKNTLEDLFFYVNGDDNLAILHLKTKISIADFEKLNLSFKKKESK